jgi:hypothetical protein
VGVLDLLSPGKWIGGAIKTALTGPLIGGMVDGYKAKLSAENTTDKLLADLAGRELELERRERELASDQMKMDSGRWWTAAPRAVVMWSCAIFIAKCIVWDKVLALGTTDKLGGDIANVFGLVIAFWFGGRTLEKISTIWTLRKR